MKRFVLLAALFALSSSAFAQEPDQQKIIATLNSVEKRLWRGDIKALDDVKALPGDHAVAGLLMFFKQHFYVYSTQVEQKAIARKAALYITQCPTAGDYFKRLFKKEAGRPKSGMLTQMREATLDAMTDAKNSFAVNLLIELMDEADLEIPVGDLSVALAKMNIAGAPFTRENPRDPISPKGATTPEGITKWKEWWNANKASFEN